MDPLFFVLDASGFCVSRTKIGEERDVMGIKWRVGGTEVGVEKWRWREVSD